MSLLFALADLSNELKQQYRRFPAKDSTLDIDFVNNRQRVAGVYGAALDGVTFTRSTTGTYFGATGTMQTAAINAPRFEYDPVSRRPLGLLIEESRGNDILYSDDFRDTASAGSARPWTNSGTVVTPASAVAPDGTLTAQLINSSAEVGVRQSNNITNQTITASIFVKAGTAAALRFRDDNNEKSVVFSPATGIISSQSGVIAASCQSVGAGWFRIIATYTTTTASWALNIRPTSTGTFYAWGAQVELGTFPTSYIPTTTASVTRGADVASMTGANFSSWYTNGLACFVELSLVGLVSGQTVYHIGNGGFNDRISTRNDGSSIVSRCIANDTTQATLTAQTVQTSTVISHIFSVFENDFAVCGANVLAFDTAGILPSPASISIGNAYNGSFLNGHIRRLASYPKRLPNNLLQYLSRLTA